ncbi:MAG: proline--tRNA ligase [Candidatus Latescibacteria bacterium]|nr:proline--tRNA ligase [Candidatus Latescibacterota bacterium]NIM21339.1 proline--tRNA ligase [Candidatus Latescibacterota bacterium]NIM65520.1 proline--tRNA ligase [Candidatus Latescibacterota bacterium]NIO01900.1 proline--tRNA ligase [Candidatus Latescibacterota bacterium]NIO28713.1 proline--tRNA ligase [Candidatus Latescibacterota bacterium]
MRWTKYYLPTFKETPSDAEIPSHKLMLRAGLIRKLTAGVYTFLPLGFRVLKKIETIVREEMDRIGCQEVLMPILHPSELYKESGRFQHFGPELFKLHDRRNRLFALGPTHEEVITDMARSELKSYRQLPQCHYQILTKFRDEIRPRFGVMRAREFIMKDAYSFHTSEESLDEIYEKMAGAYRRILDRCGLSNVMVEADAGKIGGDINHEFVVLAQEGESEIFSCSCGYAANDERAESLGRPAEVKEPVLDTPQKIKTPGQKTVEEVTAFLGAKPSQLVKTLLYKTSNKTVAALIGGDRTLSETKFSKIVGDPMIEPLSDEEIFELTGAEVGYSGPVGLPKDTMIIADTLLEEFQGMIVGANETDAHLRGVKMGRDFTPNASANISRARAGDRCPRCEKGTLSVQRGVELGHIFKLGTKYSESMGATYLDDDGKERPFIMGCYGFGVSRTVAAAIEQHHDEKGIIWPSSITPMHVLVLPVNIADAQTRNTAEMLYEDLRGAGFDVLLDDRDLRPGYKFKDADLIGIPLRITLGERNLKKGMIEIYYRREDRSELVRKKDVIHTIQRFYEPDQ